MCALLLCLAAPSMGWAADACSGIPGLLANGSLEVPDISSPVPSALQTFGSPPLQVKIYSADDVPGWNTTATDNRIELWQSGFNGVVSFDGQQHAEVNANRFGAFFQDLQSTPETEVLWEFAHRGRSGVDTVEVLIGPVAGPLDSQGAFSTDNDDWVLYSGRYDVPVGQSTTRFEFRAIATANGNTSVGNFVDGLRIAPSCDYGDAPGSFPVARANNGAAHLVRSNVFLGSLADTEVDGSPSAGDSDDARDSDDEDGVSYGHPPFGTLFRDIPNNITIEANQAGFVNLWVDFDSDEAWANSEQVLADVPVSAGLQELQIVPPAASALGPTFARLRYTTDDPNGALGSGGDWANGEVEDDQILIAEGPSPDIEITKTVSVEQDPVSQAALPKAIPGALVVYTIRVTNNDLGSNDRGSLVVTDDLPEEVDFYSGDFDGAGSPFIFTEVSPNTGVRFDFASLGDLTDDVVFLNASNVGVVPNGSFDPLIRSLRFEFDEQLAQSGASFTIAFRARLR